MKRKYPMKISRYYLGLIREKDDPIWKQCVPSREELEDSFNIEDPLDEERHTPVPYLVHKYPDRVLLLVSSKCAMYCRFCTRKRKVGRIQQIPMEDIFNAIDYISVHREVRDVIVSGGDPLMRPDKEIEMILARLREIPHVEIIRLGTRMPCVNPSRVTPRLAKMIRKYHPVFMNIQFNHPSEITPVSARACEILANAGIPLGSQTVLLKGVNDSVEVMTQLMQKLLQIRVKPYYIYQCDLVQGVEHFRTSVEDGIEILKKMQGFTSGLAVPHYVIDGPGGKIPVSPQYVKAITPSNVTVTNYEDEYFSYPGLRNGVAAAIPNKHVVRVGLAYNMKKESKSTERADQYAEFDDPETIQAIRSAIESMGFEVVLLEADLDFIERVKSAEVDFVFNIAEGVRGESRESHVPAILEMLNIPYSGSGVLTQALTLNKSRMKEVLHYHGIPTPKYQVFRSVNQKLDPMLRFPLIVKPDAEGSSVGITNESLVYDPQALKDQVGNVLRNYSQSALVEEYVDGREFTVSFLGNGKPKILPLVEISFDYLPQGVNPIDSFEVKWIFDNPDNPLDPVKCPAPVDDKLKKRIERAALKTYSVLGCVDFCRIDVRLDKLGQPNILDVNALPGLIPDPKQNSRFPKACYTAGMSYNEIIREIMDSAFKRYNLRR